MSERRQVLEHFIAQKDWMDQRVQAGIEAHRKGDACITVTDENGAPIPGVKVHIRQTGHAFRYGSNLFMLEEFENEEKNEKYKEIMRSFGNMATLPFYWDATEPERGKTRYHKDSVKVYRRPAIDLCIEFCRENGIEPREHALAYEYFFPKWLYDADIPTIQKELEKRFKEISERYAGSIPTIEVTNEMIHRQGRTAFYDDPDYVTWCFELAKKYFPNNQLVINEGTRFIWDGVGRPSNQYYAYTENAMLKGARIDAIGMQFHMFFRREDEYEKSRDRYNPERLYRQMALFDQLGKPLQITEITIPAYTDAPEDEALQAEIIEYLYSIWFSHPSVEQIIYWNMVDGYAHLWDPDPEKIRASQGNMSLGENYYRGGLLRFDLSPKPAYFAIKNLFEKKWRTHLDGCTAADGRLNFRGFYGDYEAEITVNGETKKQKFTLNRGDENTVAIKW